MISFFANVFGQAPFFTIIIVIVVVVATVVVSLLLSLPSDNAYRNIHFQSDINK